MNHYLFYALNVLFFALPLALFEINLEKASGWGGTFPKNKWYGKSFIRGTRFGRVLTKITKLEAPLNYHVIIMILFPTVFALEYIFGTRNIWLIISCFWGVNFPSLLKQNALNKTPGFVGYFYVMSECPAIKKF